MTGTNDKEQDVIGKHWKKMDKSADGALWAKILQETLWMEF